jgi:SsrA-binding protein
LFVRIKYANKKGEKVMLAIKAKELVKRYKNITAVDKLDLEIAEGELFALGVHISPYEQGNIFNKDPLRPKKLLMHKREIMRLSGLVSREGYTLVPLSLYFKGSYVKMALGLCKGKKLYDKRDDIAKRDADRVIERRMKDRSGKYDD